MIYTNETKENPITGMGSHEAQELSKQLPDGYAIVPYSVAKSFMTLFPSRFKEMQSLASYGIMEESACD
jgi:hypothetical protein